MKTITKRSFYIFAFVILGVLLQFLAHALIEIWYIGLLVNDFSKYGLGLSWDFWLWIHGIGSIIFLAVGILFGLWQGKYWWHRIYGYKLRTI